MKKWFTLLISICLLSSVLLSCEDGLELDENIPLGNPELIITGIEPSRGLKLDTLTIFGSGFNTITFQNQVLFTTNVLSTFYVEETGLVTDSIITTFLTSSNSLNAAKVVEALPDRMRVIVPLNNIATSGPIHVAFGVDTVRSDEFFTLISDRARPDIEGNDGISPIFGAPGQVVDIKVNNLAPIGTQDSTLIRFGDTVIPVDSALSSFLLRVRVPNLFAGPIDIFAGSITKTQDTVWSTPKNFGILPPPTAPLTVGTYDAFGQSTIFKEIIGFGKTVITENGPFISSGDYEVNNVNLSNPRGVAIDTISGFFYWINTNEIGSVTEIIKGDLAAENANLSILNTSLIDYQDIAIRNEQLYIGGADIRRFALDDNGNVQSGDGLLWAGEASTMITNLKINGNTFYWCDNGNRTIYTGEIGGGEINNVQGLYTLSNGLQDPRAIAIDDFRSLIYISDRRFGENVILRGNLSGEGDLTVVYNDENQLAISDLEIDLINEFLYFTTPNGIFRRTTSGGNANAVPVYPFPQPRFFDF